MNAKLRKSQERDPVRIEGAVIDVTECKRAEEVLCKSEERFRVIFEHSTFGKSLTAPNGRLLKINQAFANLLGYTIAEMQQLDFVRITHPEDLAKSRECIRCLLANERDTYRIEKRYIHKNGQVVWADVSTTLLRDGTGTPLYFITSIADITGRKRTEEQLLQLRKAVETMHLGVTITDLDRKIVYTNLADAAMHGYTAEELVGKDASIFAPVELRQPMTWEHVEQTKNWIRESINIRKDGSRFPVQLITDIVHDADGCALAIVTTCEDITERKQAEERLRYQAALLENVSDAIISTDNEFNILTWNRAAEKLYGWDAKEVLGKKVSTVISVEYPQNDREEVLRGFRTSGQWQGEVIQQKKNGEKCYVLSSVVTLLNQEGHPIGAIAANRDITERKQAEDMLRLKNLVFDASIAANSTADTQGIINEANNAFLKLWGYSSKDEIIGKPILDFLQHEQEAVTILTALDTAGVWEGEYTAKRKDGSTFVAYGLATVLRDKHDELIGYQSSVLDITEQKRMMEELRQTRDLLEQRVAERTAELTLLNKELAHASRLKDEFLANMSHDLRTPLNSILGFAQILQTSENLNAYQQKQLKTIQTSGEHLLSMINDILDLSKIEAGRMELQIGELHLFNFLQSIIDMIWIRAEQKGLAFVSEIATDLPVVVRTDEKRLQEVLMNLLSNAVKFTERGSVTFRVKVCSDRFSGRDVCSGRFSGLLTPDPSQEGKERTAEAVTTNLKTTDLASNIRFEVEDTGIGITSEHLDEIFLPFHLAHTRFSSGRGGEEDSLVCSPKKSAMISSTVLV
jgi:PAS domain S-box-containing protein